MYFSRDFNYGNWKSMLLTVEVASRFEPVDEPGFNFEQFRRNLVWRQYEVNTACRARTERHPTYFRRTILRKCGSPCFLDAPATCRAITVVARKNNTDRTCTHGRCKGGEKYVYLCIPSAARRNDTQGAVLKRKIGVTWNHIDLIGSYSHPGVSKRDSHVCVT